MSQLLEEVQDLVEKHEQKLVYYAHSIINDLDHARDIVQECFIKYINSRSKGDEIMNVKAWLYKVVYNKAVDLIRKNKRHSELEIDIQENISGNLTSNRPDQLLQNKEDMEWLKNQLNSLGEKEVDIIKMRIYQEKSYKEIADELGLSVGHVGIILHQIMKKLQHDKKEMSCGGTK